MNLLDFIRAVAALAVTLGLVGLAAVALRKFGPEWMQRLQSVTDKRVRRLTLVESLPLDPTRRLVLIRLDGEERLILLGEGRLLTPEATPAPEAAAKPRTSPRTPKSQVVA